MCACVYVIEIRCDMLHNEKIKYASLCIFYTMYTVNMYRNIWNARAPWK